MFAIAYAVVLALASSVLAQPSPLTPLAAEVGQPCQITWVADATGKWTQTNIQLMSGDNNNMVPVTTVTTVDTTSGAPTTFTWTCPDVTLYSPIYFYQFSHATEPTNLIWTTRWAIESASGSFVPPPNPSQPGAAPGTPAVPWGIGLLKDQAAVKPPPAYITGQSVPANVTTSGTASISGSASMTATVSTVPTGTAAMVTVTTATVASTSAPSAPTGSAAASGASLSRAQGSVLAAGVGAVFAAVFALV